MTYTLYSSNIMYIGQGSTEAYNTVQYSTLNCLVYDTVQIVVLVGATVDHHV